MKVLRFVFIVLIVQLPHIKKSKAGGDFTHTPQFTLSADSIRSYLIVLTADSLQGREAGTEGQRKAAEYLTSLYERWNIPAAPAQKRFQNHPLGIKSNKTFNLKAAGMEFLYYRDFYYLPGKPDTSLIINKVFFGGYGHETKELNELEKLSPENKAILIHAEALTGKRANGLPVWSLMDKLQVLAKKNLALVLVSVDTLYTLINKLENDLAFTNNISQLPFRVLFLETKHVSQLLDSSGFNLEEKLEKINRTIRPQSKEVELQITLNTLNNTSALIGQNIFGYIEGTDLKEEVIVLSAHYDHLGIHKNEIHYGADDDGSGTAAVMEMARLFSEALKTGYRPRRSILFFNTCGEEKGLSGSKWYVEHPFFSAEKVIVNLNTAMVGRVDSIHEAEENPNYVYIISSFGDSKDLIEYNEDINKRTTVLTLDYKYSDPADKNAFYRRSDHYNFVKKGVPVLFYFNGTHADYHRPTDTIDKINFSMLTKRAQLIFNSAQSISNDNVYFRRPAKSE